MTVQTDFIKFSVCDLLKKGIGSSSSHTLAPWRSAMACYDALATGGWLADLEAVSVTLYGSLAFVGRGHYTTIAIPLGLLGKDVMTFDVSSQLKATLGIPSITDIAQLSSLAYPGGPTVAYQLIFDTREDTDKEKMVFRFTYRDGAPASGRPDELTYYSYGGGSYGTAPVMQPLYQALTSLPVEYVDAATLVAAAPGDLCEAIMQNEEAFAQYRKAHPDPAQPGLPTDRAGVVAYLQDIGLQMGTLIYDGVTYADDDDCYKVMFATPRAKTLYRNLIGDRADTSTQEAFFRSLRRLSRDFSFEQQLDLVSLFALAVSEQNGALKHVVTAPTNGSCGTVPAVLYHYIVTQADEDEIDWLFGRTPGTPLNGILRFLIIASTVGGIVKSNANISGGVGGCQAEVGTSGAMAAGGLAHLLGGNNNIITFNAAEASLEDQLGSTCDPVGGLVELPCIDRNLSAAIVAVTVAQAMAKLGTAFVSDIPFDKAVTAMQQISENMNDQYKETSTGGLALVMQDEVKARRPDLFPPTRELCTARSHMRISLSRTTC